MRVLGGTLGRSFPDATARIALEAWLRPRRFTPPRREAHWQMGATEFRVGRGTHGVRAWSWGEGPIVLLAHGWEGRGLQLGGFVRPLVDAGFRVVTWDAPAHGQSGGRKSSLFSFADTIGAVIRQLGPVHAVVAHSMGAAATLFALKPGLPVSRLALIAPGDPSEATARMAELLGLHDDVTDAMRERMQARFGMTLSEVSTEKLAAELEQPMLVIHDEDDVHAEVESGRRIAEAAPHGSFTATQGLGHHRILRDSHVIEQIASFVADRPVTLRNTGRLGLTIEDVLADLNHGRG